MLSNQSKVKLKIDLSSESVPSSIVDTDMAAADLLFLSLCAPIFWIANAAFFVHVSPSRTDKIVVCRSITFKMYGFPRQSWILQKCLSLCTHSPVEAIERFIWADKS